MLSLSGLTPADAVFVSSMQEARPLLSIFLIVPLATKYGPPNVLCFTLFLGMLCIAWMGLTNLPYYPLLPVIFLIGAGTVGSMTGIHGMTAALYPARVRNTGMGWALARGRAAGDGAAAAPDIFGDLLDSGNRHRNNAGTRAPWATTGGSGFTGGLNRMRYWFLALALALFPALAHAQKQGGILRVQHRDSPSSMSIHEEGTISTVLPVMGVFNNLAVYDQHSRKTAWKPSCRSWQRVGRGTPTSPS